MCLTLCDFTDCSPPGSSVHGDSPGKNTGVGCHAFFQWIFPIQGSSPGLPHCRWILSHLSHQRSPYYSLWKWKWKVQWYIISHPLRCCYGNKVRSAFSRGLKSTYWYQNVVKKNTVIFFFLWDTQPGPKQGEWTAHA